VAKQLPTVPEARHRYPHASALIARAVSRRSILGSLAGIAGAAALSACGSTSTGTPTVAASTAVAAVAATATTGTTTAAPASGSSSAGPTTTQAIATQTASSAQPATATAASSASGTQAASASQAASANAVSQAAVPLDYAAPLAASDLPFMQQVIDTFQAQNPGIKINFNNITGPYETGVIPTWAAAGSLPDVLFVRGAYTGEFVAKQFIQAIDDLIARDAKEVDTADLWPQQVESDFKFRGKWYLLPYDFSILGIYYNKTLFQARGMAEPTKDWSWTDLQDLGQKLTVTSGGQRTQWGLGNLPRISEVQAHLWAAGGALLSADLSTCVVNDPAYAAKNATILQYFADLSNVQHIVPTASEFKGNPFGLDRSGLEVDGSWATLSYRLQIKKQFDWDVQWWPQNKETGKRGVVAAGAGESIGPTTKRRDTAWTWLKALTSREALVTMIANPIRSVPGRQSAAQVWTATVKSGALAPQHANVFPDMFSASFPQHPITFRTQLNTISGKVLGPVFTGQKRASDVLLDWQQQVAYVISQDKQHYGYVS